MRYLEARLVGLAQVAKRAELDNGTAPSAGGLSEAETADMESFLRDMLLIFPALEVTAFQIAKSVPAAGPPRDQRRPTWAGCPFFILADVSLREPALTHRKASSFALERKGRAVPVPSIHEWLENVRTNLEGSRASSP